MKVTIGVKPPQGDLQLVAIEEDVVDVPATLAARVRVLASGRSNQE